LIRPFIEYVLVKLKSAALIKWLSASKKNESCTPNHRTKNNHLHMDSVSDFFGYCMHGWNWPLDSSRHRLNT